MDIFTIILNLLLLAVGFFLLSKGADFFVDGAANIAKKLKIPQLIIGLTIVAMGTSAPEAAVSISAALKSNAEITIGNVVGSNILNILIILGISSLITPLIVKKSTVFIDIPVTIGATVLLFLIGFDGNIYWYEGLILLVVFIAYLLILFFNAKKNKEENEEEITEFSLTKAIIFTILGLVMIIVGSNVTVDSAKVIASAIGLSDRFIGLTIVALGTSLPELFTSVTAATKKNADIAIGNIVGSCIFNILFIVGITAVITPVPFAESFRIDTFIALYSAVLLLLCVIKTNKLSFWAGIIMLCSYVGYFIYLII